MLLIPAIDLKSGRCVRLRQGRMEDETVFSDNPLAVAQRWVDAGTRRLHIVDLDGAVSGRPENAEIIHSITERFPDLPVQVGGGIRDDDTIQSYLDAGVTYIIIGTKAVNAPHFVADVCAEFPGRIFIGLDARNGKVATDGWSKLSHHDVVDLAQQFERHGAECIVYTDIERDGMLTGPNVEATVRLARSIKIPVIASGGIHTIEDVRALSEVADEGIVGAITGRAIYEGSLDFHEGQSLADRIAAGES
jgi:phosphoribosylformimino-5-aminoimidazole carboxamide ribotide isomerase